MADAKAENWYGAGGPASHRSLGPVRARCACGWCYPDDWCPCCRIANGQLRVWVDPEALRDGVIGIIADRDDSEGRTLAWAANRILGLIGVQDE